MNKFKMVAACLSLVFAVSANANVYFDLKASLISYSLFLPGSTPQLQILDPSEPDASGRLWMNELNTGISSIGLTPDYHAVQLLNGAGTITYAGLQQVSTSAFDQSFDPVTGRLIASGGARTQWGIGSWCTSQLVSTCAALYGEQKPGVYTNGFMQLDLLFIKDADHEAINGTAIVRTNLGNGGWIDRTYSLSGLNVPLPVSGLLFGSALAALAGVARRRDA